MYQHMVSHETTHLYGFINPAHVAPKSDSVERRGQLMLQAMQRAKPGQLFFCPYNENFHWTLGIIDPWSTKYYFLDPVSSEPRKGLHEVVCR